MTNQAAKGADDPILQWVTFRLVNETYGINVMQVQEVLRYTEIAPVPGAPASNKALPAIFLDLIISTTIPAASLAFSYPHSPCEISLAVKSSFKPSPLICVWVATLWVLVVLLTSSIFIAVT